MRSHRWLYVEATGNAGEDILFCNAASMQRTKKNNKEKRECWIGICQPVAPPPPLHPLPPFTQSVERFCAVEDIDHRIAG